MPPKHKNGCFNKPSTVFGSDMELPEPKDLRPASAAIIANRAEHDRAFKPSGAKSRLQSYHPTISRYPEW